MIDCQPSLDISKMNESVLHFKLDNGLSVILKEDHSSPVTAMHLRVKTGSIHEIESYGSGLSHFFEHSLFLGSKNHPLKDSYSAEIESYGGADVNAYTTFDHTAYHFSVLSKYSAPALRALEDLVFHPLFPQEDVENEMGSILSEMDMGDDNPDRFFSKFNFRTIFEKLPYKYPVIGYKDLFSKLDVEELLAYYQKTYVPNNMILSIAGDFESEKMVALIEEIFGRHEKKELPDLLFENEKPWKKQRRAEISHPKAAYPRMAMVWQTVSYYSEDMYPLDVLSSMLGSGLGSLLHQELKEEKKLVENVGSFSWTPKYKGIFEVSYDLPVMEDRKKVSERILRLEKETLAIIETIQKGEIDAYRLDTVKRAVLTSFFHGKETALMQAQGLAGSVMATEDSIHYDETYLQGIEKVRQEDIIRVAKKYFSQANSLSTVMVSTKLHKEGTLFPDSIQDNGKKEIAFSKGKDTRKIPSATPSLVDYAQLKKAFKKKKQQKTKKTMLEREVFANGLTLLHRQIDRLPKISVTLVAKGGVIAEKEGIPNGSFELLSSMFLTGNEQFSKEELIKALKLHGISVEPFSGKYSFGLKMSFLNDRIDEAKKIFASMVNQSEFHQEDFQTEKDDQLFAIKQSEENGWSVSGRHFKKIFFKGSLLENSSQGDRESVQAIELPGLEKLKKEMLTPANLVVSVYGDLPFEKAKEIVAFLSKKAKDEISKQDKVDISALTYPGPKEISKNQQVGSKQSYFRLAYRAPSMDSPDRPAFKILSGYLAGMGGPLFKLRSEPFGNSGGGRAYQLGAFYDDSRDYGALVFYAALRYEARNEYKWAISSFREEIKALLKDPLDASELHRAKLSVLGRETTANQRIDSLAFNEALYELYGLGAETYQDFRDKLSEVTAKQIQEVAQKYLNTDQYVSHVLLPKN